MTTHEGVYEGQQPAQQEGQRVRGPPHQAL